MFVRKVRPSLQCKEKWIIRTSLLLETVKLSVKQEPFIKRES